MYTQGPPTPIHYRDEVLVELALLQYWGVITTLTYSKYSSPIFVVRKKLSQKSAENLHFSLLLDNTISLHINSKWPPFNSSLIYIFKGTEKENLNEFPRQLESCFQVAVVPAADRHRYLHLHLKGGALTFFDQQEAAVRDDYNQAVAALRDRYQIDQRIQLQKLLFNSRKMEVSQESAQDFLTELQRLALEAYPNVVARAAAGGRPAVVAEHRAQEHDE